jgi:uncharacterized membrane protein YkvA (DUF1232 family)
MKQFKRYVKQFKENQGAYEKIFKDPKTPSLARFFLSLAIGYSSNKLDIIPDVIPFFGHLDDYILVPLFIFLARFFTPNSLLVEYHLNNH